MIDLIQLHDALRFSGFGPDVPFHATESGHELKLRKVLEELGDTPLAEERIDELEELVNQHESEANEARSDLREEERERERLEAELSVVKRELNALRDAQPGAAQ